MALRDVEHDRSRLEQAEIAFLIGRNLAERIDRQMRELPHRAEREETNIVWLADFLERPANAHVARLPPAAVGRPFKGGDGGDHRQAPSA